MASRQVTLLREAYLLGWLTFDDQNPWASKREQHILNAVENRLYRELLHTRYNAASHLAPLSEKFFREAREVYISLREITLPYHSKEANIDKREPLTDAKIEEYKQLMQALKQDTKPDGH